MRLIVLLVIYFLSGTLRAEPGSVSAEWFDYNEVGKNMSSKDLSDIGYMQVQIRLYRNNKLYDEFAFNARDGKYQTKTAHVRAIFEAIDDPAKTAVKVVTLLIKIAEDDYTIAMLIPVHQSTGWETSNISDTYAVKVYCISGGDK